MGKSKEKWMYDIEVFPNYFCVGLKNFTTKQLIYYEISERQDDRKDIFEWFNKYSDFLISFNGIHYDNVVISYLLRNWKKIILLNAIECCAFLKAFSNKVIHQDEYWEDIKWYKWTKHKWIDIDFMTYWSLQLRRQKQISLKALGIQLGYPVVQELPFPHDELLSLESLDILKHYNTVHDLGILEMLTVELTPAIQLRQLINKDYRLDCWSWDAIKIASETLLVNYCQQTGKNEKEVRDSRYYNNNFHLRDILSDFSPKFELKVFQDLYERIRNSYNTFSEEILVTEGDTNIRLTYGIGGLHSVNCNEKYYSNEKQLVKTADFASLYPRLIINYRTIRFPEVLHRYSEIKDERLIAKKAKLKVKDTFLKLILNGISGLLDSGYSWLNYHEGAMRLRIIGQMVLTKVIEMCILRNWKVISANTDGIEMIIPVEDEEEYNMAFRDIELQFDLELEHDTYESIVYANVNNYIAVTKANEEKKSSTKRKGIFKLKHEIPLGDSVNELVISICLNLYFTQGILPQTVIENPEKYGLHIYDFCRSNKIAKNYKVIWNNERQQQLNRYYVCKNAPYLYKRKNTKQTLENVLAGWGVQLYNEHKELPLSEYNIDYRYYLSKISKIITDLNNKNQTKLELF